MADLVSVIIPIYNAEKYLKSCIESVTNQTYTNLEIILVDDGSTDNSGEICDNYAKKDDRIHVIHKPNGGNGDARNAGLDYAHGWWIVCADNDDILNTRQIEILLNVAKKKNADIAVGGYKAIGDDVETIDDVLDDEMVNKTEVLNDSHLYDDKFIEKCSMILTTPWSKIYRKEMFDGVRYPLKSKHDDTWTTWKTYEKAKRVTFTPAPLYYWRQNPDSFGKGVFDESHFDGIDAYIEQLEYYHKARKQRYVEIVFAEFTQDIFWCYNRMKEYDLDTTSLRKYHKYMRKHLNYIKLTKSLGLKQWLRYRYLAYYKIPKIIK
jgi:glycosyltransferase involved in cell wall biosynthesis